MDILYHYTTGSVFRRILMQGAILPDKNEPDNEAEIGTVTFSSNPIWEKSRYRVGKMPDGQLVMMDKKMLQQYDGGLIRIVVPASVAPLDWRGMKESCNLSQRVSKGLYDFAIEVGARPSQWFSCTDPVPEDVWITVEKLDENENWIELPDDEIPEPTTTEEEFSPVVNIVPSENPSAVALPPLCELKEIE